MRNVHKSLARKSDRKVILRRPRNSWWEGDNIKFFTEEMSWSWV
jgi:hypothetical protein